MNLKRLKKTWDNLGKIYDYPFTKVRDSLVMGIEDVRNEGYDSYVGQITLEVKNENATNITIAIWCRNDDGTNSSFSASQEFFGIRNMPSFIEDELIMKRRFEVVLSMDDMDDIHSDRMVEINTSKGTLPDVIRGKLHRMGIRNCHVAAKITDIGIYYKVRVFDEDNPSKNLLSILTLPVEGLTSSEKERLDTVHNVEIPILGV